MGHHCSVKRNGCSHSDAPFVELLCKSYIMNQPGAVFLSQLHVPAACTNHALQTACLQQHQLNGVCPPKKWFTSRKVRAIVWESNGQDVGVERSAVGRHLVWRGTCWCTCVLKSYGELPSLCMDISVRIREDLKLVFTIGKMVKGPPCYSLFQVLTVLHMKRRFQKAQNKYLE